VFIKSKPYTAKANTQGLEARQMVAQGKQDEVRAALGKSSNKKPEP
jgi:hypothetical protein